MKILPASVRTCCSKKRVARGSRFYSSRRFDSISTPPAAVSFSSDFNIGHVCRFTSFRVYCRDDIHPRCETPSRPEALEITLQAVEIYFQTIDWKILLDPLFQTCKLPVVLYTLALIPAGMSFLTLQTDKYSHAVTLLRALRFR